MLETISGEVDRALGLNCSGFEASPPQGNTHWLVPRSVNTMFTGRLEVIEKIANAIKSPADTQKRFILTGMGGQGKSEICLKVASQVRQE